MIWIDEKSAFVEFSKSWRSLALIFVNLLQYQFMNDLILEIGDGSISPQFLEDVSVTRFDLQVIEIAELVEMCWKVCPMWLQWKT